MSGGQEGRVRAIYGRFYGASQLMAHSYGTFSTDGTFLMAHSDRWKIPIGAFLHKKLVGSFPQAHTCEGGCKGGCEDKERRPSFEP